MAAALIITRAETKTSKEKKGIQKWVQYKLIFYFWSAIFDMSDSCDEITIQIIMKNLSVLIKINVWRGFI